MTKCWSEEAEWGFQKKLICCWRTPAMLEVNPRCSEPKVAVTPLLRVIKYTPCECVCLTPKSLVTFRWDSKFFEQSLLCSQNWTEKPAPRDKKRGGWTQNLFLPNRQWPQTKNYVCYMLEPTALSNNRNVLVFFFMTNCVFMCSSSVCFYSLQWRTVCVPVRNMPGGDAVALSLQRGTGISSSRMKMRDYNM